MKLFITESKLHFLGKRTFQDQPISGTWVSPSHIKPRGRRGISGGTLFLQGSTQAPRHTCTEVLGICSLQVHTGCGGRCISMRSGLAWGCSQSPELESSSSHDGGSTSQWHHVGLHGHPGHNNSHSSCRPPVIEDQHNPRFLPVPGAHACTHVTSLLLRPQRQGK